MDKDKIEIEENTSKVILGDSPGDGREMVFDFYNEELEPTVVHNTGKDGEDILIGNQLYDFGLEPIPNTGEPSVVYEFGDADTPGGEGFPTAHYETENPNENALVIDSNTDYNMILVDKSGDSTTNTSAHTGDNAAVYTNKGIRTAVTESQINAEADYGIGIFVKNAEYSSSSSDIYTVGNNSPAIYAFELGKFASYADIVQTIGENSPIIKFGDRSNLIILDGIFTSIRPGSPLLYGTFRNSKVSIDTIFGSVNQSNIAIIESPAAISIKNSEIVGRYGFDLKHSGERTEHDYVLDIDNTSVSIKDLTSPMFDTANGDFYINLNNVVFNNIETFVEANNWADTQVNATDTGICGHFHLDNKSALRLRLIDSEFNGAIIKDSGDTEYSEYFDHTDNIRVTLENSVWNLTGDSYITELIIDKESDINLNGFTLTVKNLTSDLVVGSVVNYHSADKTIVEEDLIVIKVIDENTYVVYDTDDYITYTATLDELIFTGRVVDVQPLLDELDQLRIKEIHDRPIENGDKLSSDNDDEPVIIIDNETKDYIDIDIEKHGTNTNGDPIEGRNAAVWVLNSGIFDYKDSRINTYDDYSPGIVVEDEFSNLDMNRIEINTTGDNSIGVIALDKALIYGEKNYIETQGTGSHPLYAASQSVVRYNDITLKGNGRDTNTINADTNTKVEITKGTLVIEEQGDNVIYAVGGSNVEVHDSYIKSSSDLSAVYVQGATVSVDPSVIETNNQAAYELDGNATVTSTENTITVGQASPVIIRNQNNTFISENDTFNTTILDDETEAPVIKIFEGTPTNPVTADITIDGSKFNNEETVFLELSGYCTVNLTLKDWIKGNIIVNDEETDRVTLNITIEGRWVGVINKHQWTQKGTVNVKCVNAGIWDLTDDVYISSFDAPAQASVIYNTKNIYVNGVKYHFGPDTPIDIDSGYTTTLSPTQRTLKILHSKNLPKREDRDKMYMYFTYDKLHFYVYQSLYTDPFCIVEKLPTNSNVMVENMLYITMNGDVYTYMSYKVIKLGQVENYDPAQLQLLRMCGTTYFMSAESRYLDLQTKTVQLPFQNGTYQLNLNLLENTIIDEDTVIRFDPIKQQFYIAGKEYQFDDRLNNIGKYKGVETPTMYNYVDADSFRSFVKVSNNADNGLVIRPDGLFINASDLAKQSSYSDMVNAFATYKMIIDSYVNELRDAVLAVAGTISEETIAEKIQNSLESYQPTIDNMFSNYDNIENRIDNIEQTIGSGMDERIEQAKQEIRDYISNINQAWSEVSETSDDVEYSASDFAVQTDILDTYRSIVAELRALETAAPVILGEGEDPEELSGDDEEETPVTPKTYNKAGLTENEQIVQDNILAIFNTERKAAKNRITYSSYDLLPIVGNSSKLYYIVDLSDEENKVFQIWIWRDPTYHEDGTVEISGDYICILDLYPREPEPEPEEPETPDPEEPEPEDPEETEP